MAASASLSASCGCSCSLRTNPKGLNFGQHANKFGASLLNSHLSKSNSNSNSTRPLKIVCARRVSSRQQEKERNKENRYSSSDVKAATSIPMEEEFEEEFADDGEEEVIKLPGDEPDFWEGPQWNTVGFIMQYLWAFGIVFALVACGIAVRTYNFGATDFKETPVFKEALESQGLFEEAPETPDSQVFEDNPAEVAPPP